MVSSFPMNTTNNKPSYFYSWSIIVNTFRFLFCAPSRMITCTAVGHRAKNLSEQKTVRSALKYCDSYCDSKTAARAPPTHYIRVLNPLGDPLGQLRMDRNGNCRNVMCDVRASPTGVVSKIANNKPCAVAHFPPIRVVRFVF